LSASLKQANQTNAHAVYNLKLHIVFVTKYGRKTLTPDLLVYLKSAFADILIAWRCELLEFGGEPDHVHLLISIHPALDISVLINNLKTATARRARNRCRTPWPVLLEAALLAPSLFRFVGRRCLTGNYKGLCRTTGN